MDQQLQKKLQLVLAPVSNTGNGYAENNWIIGVCKMRKKVPQKIQTLKSLNVGFKSGIGIFVSTSSRQEDPSGGYFPK